ncbi:MAG: hypothetical protein IIC01_10590 [Planctomycetes bacterium]|nr:hypothetical protein [Planctomycetota bacterium]
MNRCSSRLVAVSLLAVAVVVCMTDRAAACAVCYGDPDSPMAKGVVAGVLTLVGVIGFVLVGIAGTGLFWIQRSRRLGRLEDNERHPDR